MEKLEFEDKLVQMTKPEVTELKHQEILADAISRAKDRSVVSGWWLSIPLYVIAALLMKTFYMPQSSFVSNIHDMISKQAVLSVFILLITPVAAIIINFISIKKIYLFSGNMSTASLLKTAWYNFLMILLSILIILIFLF